MKQLTDGYQLVRQLGRGGMGEVWAGSRTGPNGVCMTCAIKLLHREMAETPRELQMFFNEARIASQLDHSRIVKVFDVGTADDGAPFIVMEWVDGVNLRAFSAAAQQHGFWPLELDLVTYIVGEILAALEYAHDRTIGGMDAGVIHSDVTPGNIMISSSGEVKLTDFGISRFAANAGPMSRAIGTPRYMSPEQITGHPRRETDIYGLGVVLHELLDGRRYLDGYGPEQFQAQILMGAPPDLVRTNVPPWLDDLRRRMLANRADQRPSARAVRTVLVDNCPRYMAAAEELKNRYYPRLIGRKRSGMTELMDIGAIETAVRKQMLGASPKPILSSTEPTGTGQRDREQAAPTALEASRHAAREDSQGDRDAGDVPSLSRRSSSASPADSAPTRLDEPPPLVDFDDASAGELGPDTRTASRRDQLRLSDPEPVLDRIEPTQRLSAEDMQRATQLRTAREDTQELAPAFPEQTEATGSSAMASVGRSGEPTVSGSVTLLDVPPDPQGSPVPRRIPWSMAFALLAIVGLSALSIALLVKVWRTPEQPREQPELIVETVVPPDTDEKPSEQVSVVAPKVEPDDTSATTAPPPTEPPAIETAATEPLPNTESMNTEPKDPTPTTRPAQPKLGPKVGVSFVFDAGTGLVEIAGRSKAVENGTAYMDVSSGKKHRMRFKPEGGTWQTIGTLDAKGIAPKGYLVRFQKGKLTIEERQGGTRK